METGTGKDLQDVDATTLKTWMEAGSAVLVDMREPATQGPVSHSLSE